MLITCALKHGLIILLSSPHLNSNLPPEGKVGGGSGLSDPSIRELKEGCWTSWLAWVVERERENLSPKNRREGGREGREWEKGEREEKEE